jgi:hypothetical protein
MSFRQFLSRLVSFLSVAAVCVANLCGAAIHWTDLSS